MFNFAKCVIITLDVVLLMLIGFFVGHLDTDADRDTRLGFATMSALILANIIALGVTIPVR